MMTGLIHGPLSLFILQAILIVAASRAIGLLTRRARQPMVIAEIVAGIALGPSLLGWLAPAIERVVFPAEGMPLLGMLSQVGLILFMFLVGLEFDAGKLRGRGHAAVAISHTSIIVPFALGIWLAQHLHTESRASGRAASSFALFMGAAMSITAFPVLARILVERRLLRTKVGAGRDHVRRGRRRHGLVHPRSSSRSSARARRVSWTASERRPLAIAYIVARAASRPTVDRTPRGTERQQGGPEPEHRRC